MYIYCCLQHQNGVNERNHAICDGMIKKMRMEDPSLSIEVALTWALVAKNSLENVSGFSPFQIVFGESPKLPSVYTAGPPGLEEVVMSKAVADHINALHLAREAYVSGESDRIIKAALKQRIYQRGQNINQGDWIYYKNEGKWEGPMRVCAKDGKLLYAVRAGRLLTINSDYADVAMFEGEFLGKSGVEEKLEKSTDTEDSDKLHNTYGYIERYNTIETLEQANAMEEEKGKGESKDSNEEVNKTNDKKTENKSNNINIRKNDMIRFKRTHESDWEKVKVVNRATKATGKYNTWWNVQNIVTGHKEQEDLGGMHEIMHENEGEDESVNQEAETFVMTIPRHLHNDKRCRAAKEKELNTWDNFDVYSEVVDVGQPRIGTNWVLTEKIIDGMPGVKARLTARGDQEERNSVRKDSPTIRKGKVKIFCAIAAKENWSMKSIDGTSAFLQGAPIERDVYLLPPKERRVPGLLWQLKKPVYGLTDAARGWHLALSKKLVEAGSEKCTVDPAMYFSFKQKNGEKHIDGIVLTHVDDLLHGGSTCFQNDVMVKIKASFEFSDEESEQFRYIGMNMIQNQHGVLINQDHYVQALELPDMEFVAGIKTDDIMDNDGQTEFRGWVAKLLYISVQSRPDLCFEGKCLSSKFGKATKRDMKSVYKKIHKLKGESTRMFFPDLGDISEWCIVGYSPDKVSSVGGQVILLTNKVKQLACVLNWRSKKLIRKVVSSLAGEALAMFAMVGEIVYTKAILSQIFGERISKTPVILFTDCKNLHDALYSTCLVEDSWLIPDIAVIQEALEQEVVTCVRRVGGGDLHYHLTQHGVFDEKSVLFYTAEIILGLDHMHQRSICYRDLKPANILLDESGHVRISDLGLACDFSKKRPHACVGTHGYMAPEVLRKSESYDSCADWFSLGCMMFKLLRGHSPFRQQKTKDKHEIDKMTLTMDVVYPDEFTDEMKDLLGQLLKRTVAERIGCRGRGAAELKEHIFFEGIEWKQVELLKLTPPLIPPRGEVNAADAFDIGSFDEEDVKGVKMSETDQGLYKNFNYVNSERWQQEIAETVFDVINQETERIEAKKRAKCQVEDRNIQNGDCLLNGYLHKLGGPFQSVWTKKYFFLYPNRLEYRGEQTTSQKLLIPLEDVQYVDEINYKSFKCIKIVMKDNRENQLILRAESETEYCEWFKEICKSHEEAQVHLKTGAKILSTNNRPSQHSSRDDLDTYHTDTSLLTHSSHS